jgi:uncharacterized membrane protein (Fun14 family)
MSELPAETSPPAPRTLRTWFADMPRWKKLSLLAAGALLVTGAVLTVVGPGGAPAAGVDSPTGGNPLQTGLLPGQTGGGTGGTAPAGEEPAAKGLFRLGFSFIAGFCLGAFVRATLKIAAIAFGFWLAMTVLLSYYGLVAVDWQSIDALWSKFAQNVEQEWSNFQTFVTGSLPAAGLVAAGFAIGIKRH